MNIGSILKVVRGIIKLRGASDNNLIGNVGDRLKVDAQTSSIPSNNIIMSMHSLLNGSSNNMVVDGSVTPVSFKHIVTIDSVIELITLYISDTGNMSETAFGAITGGLTTGIKIKIQSAGVVYDLVTCKNNIDLILSFSDNKVVKQSAAGFMAKDDLFLGSLFTKKEIKLYVANNDYVEIIINDDLTGLDQMRASTVLIREI